MRRLRPRWNPWHDAFAFLLLASSTLVVVLVLLATRASYARFEPAGRLLAWGVALGGVVALASLASILVRLYVQPAIADGRRRLAPPPTRRKGNP